MVEWRAVPGYEDSYEVTCTGVVRSLDRTILCGNGQRRFVPGQLIKWTSAGADRRPAVNLARSGKKIRRYVHDLVLTAHVGPRPPGMVACHEDGDQFNNSVDNLRWDTPLSNIMDTIKHGTHWLASRSTCSRGHQLVEPNLLTSRLLKGQGRACLACSRARSSAYKTKRKYGREVDIAAVANARYEAIMAPAG